MNPANRVTVYMRRAVEHKDDYEVQHWVSVNAVLAVCPDQSLATMTRIDEVMHDHLARYGRAWLANRDLLVDAVRRALDRGGSDAAARMAAFLDALLSSLISGTVRPATSHR